MKEIKCPCCGKTMVEEWDICTECNWENDPNQLRDVEYGGGANRMSLTEAREAYKKGIPVL